MARGRHAPPSIDPHGPDKSAQVRRMFSAIAPRYDLLNHWLSLNQDRRWRRRAVDRLGWERAPAGRYLDACAGTFDLALELARRRAFRGGVVATDFSRAMLREGRSKIAGQPVRPACADTLRLPFRDASFDGAMVAFGIRNLTDSAAGFRELGRVLRPKSRLVMLDFATPRWEPWRSVYLFYFTRVLPVIGRRVSQHNFAYRYLPESVLAFETPEALGSELAASGFAAVDVRRWAGGAVTLITGERS